MKREAAQQQAEPGADERAVLSKDAIRDVFLSHGFTVKEGQTDLKPYVYGAAYALLDRAAQSGQRAGVADALAEVVRTMLNTFWDAHTPEQKKALLKDGRKALADYRAAAPTQQQEGGK